MLSFIILFASAIGKSFVNKLLEKEVTEVYSPPPDMTQKALTIIKKSLAIGLKGIY